MQVSQIISYVAKLLSFGGKTYCVGGALVAESDGGVVWSLPSGDWVGEASAVDSFICPKLPDDRVA